jgi:PKD repeat protein
MNAAMQLCDSAGLTVCHAAGNDGIDQPDYLDYDPYDFEVLSVASVEGNDCKTSWSNYGYWVDISAYGSSILSTYSTIYAQPTVAYLDGTSFASPMVAGLAALIRSAMPSLNKYQVDSIIINTAHDIYDLGCNQGQYLYKLGSGRIDAEAALEGLASARFTSDVTEGAAPLTVNFTDQSPYSPTAWDWDFGTGDVSTDQNPTYVYNNPGIFDVSLIVDDSVSLGPGEEHLTNYIWVTADTVEMAHVLTPRSAQARMPVYVHNTVQIKEIQFSFYMENALGITFDSFSVVGLRTEYFDNISYNALVTNKKYGILMRPDPAGGGSNYLMPDTGAILNLYFNIPGTVPGGSILPIDSITASGKRPRYDALWGELEPVFIAGALEIQSCVRGDVDCSGGDINIADLVYLVDFMFNDGPAPDPYDVGNIDGLLLIDIADLVYLVDFMFNDGPPPPP